MFHDAAHAPQMHSLLSVSRMLDVGICVVLQSEGSHLAFPDGTRVPLRRHHGLFLLDHLVPVDTLPNASDYQDAACGAVQTELTGSETVLCMPDAQVAYPSQAPMQAGADVFNAVLNHWRWGHIKDLTATKKCTVGMHGSCKPQDNCPCCI